MDKVGIITFHASHNYGSALQAYALQKTVNRLGLKCEIINFRTDRQKDIYSVFTKRKGFRYVVKNLSHLLYFQPLTQKHDRFEEFMKEFFRLSENEYTSLEQLMENPPEYDYYISGSDQIWNPAPADFDWAFYLPFVKKGKKTSYAASFGPTGEINNEQIIKRIREYVDKYSSISVREQRSKEIVETYTRHRAQIVLDPTLLLSSSEWDALAEEPDIKGKYILFYTLFASREMMNIAKEAQRKLGLPVIVTVFSNQFDVFNTFDKQYSVGPREFLGLIKNAELIITSSFHGTVFSIKYQRPFYSINGLKDERIRSLLKATGLERRFINAYNMDQKINESFEIDFYGATENLETYCKDSLEYLRVALDRKEAK